MALSDIPLPHVDPVAVGHWFSLAGFFAALAGVAGIIPVAVAVFAGIAAGVFYTVQTMMLPPVHNWLTSRRQRKRARLIAKLQYKHSLLAARMEKLGLSTHAQISVSDGEKMITTQTHDVTTHSSD